MIKNIKGFYFMGFPERLINFRKAKGLTQKELAKEIDLHISQVGRYELGTSQPTLEVLKKLSIALSVKSDMLLFDELELEPDDDLKLQFQTVSNMPKSDKDTIKSLLDGMILKYQANKLISNKQ